MSRGRAALLAAVAAGLGLAAGAAGAAGQAGEGPLTPAGRLRIQVAPAFQTWNTRFGLRTEGGRLVEEEEPLGWDFTRSRAGTMAAPTLLPVQDALGDALDEPGYTLSFGRTRTLIRSTRITVPVRAEVGVTDWLTVGVTVPFSRRRSEVTFLLDADTSTADVGLSPSVDRGGQVSEFVGGMAQAIDAMDARAAAACDAGDPQCGALRGLADEARSFHDALSRAYDAESLFPYEGSGAASRLLSRLQQLQIRFIEGGVETLPGTLPLASAPMDTAAVQAFLTEPEHGIRGDTLDTWQSLWWVGDVEVHAAARLLEHRAPATAGLLDAPSYLVGAGALVRLGTGRQDDPANFVDLGTGDGQNDVELRVFGDVSFGRRFGLWADARYGVQLEGDRIRRVAPPEVAFPSLARRRSVRWNPGDYLDLEIAPRFHLTPELAVSARYRLWSKGEDDYALVPSGDAPEPGEPVDAAVLERETEETLREAGIGLIYSTLRRHRAGDDVRPMEIHVGYRQAVAGSGGRTPKAATMQVGLRLFWTLWGE